MGAVILRRLATSVPTIFVSTILVFALRYLLPGGPVEAMLGGGTGQYTAAQVAAIAIGILQTGGLATAGLTANWIAAGHNPRQLHLRPCARRGAAANLGDNPDGGRRAADAMPSTVRRPSGRFSMDIPAPRACHFGVAFLSRLTAVTA